MSTDGPLYPGHPSKDRKREQFLLSMDGCDITYFGGAAFVYWGAHLGEWASFETAGWDGDHLNHLPESVIQMTEALWKLHS